MAGTKHKKYLDSIGITGTLAARVLTIEALYTDRLGVQAEDIFVSEYVQQDDTRIYESLWFFSDSYIMEAKRFPRELRIDIVPIRDNIHYWSAELQDYQFSRTTKKSRMTIEITLGGGAIGTLKASGANCKTLTGLVSQIPAGQHRTGIREPLWGHVAILSPVAEFSVNCDQYSLRQTPLGSRDLSALASLETAT